MQYLFALQTWLRDSVSAEFSQYASNRDAIAAATMLPLGIFFGAVHALTPGHSKTVLASYILGSRLSVTRSLLVSLSLAFVHVASAVVLALTASSLVNRSLSGPGRAVALELISRGSLTLIGVWLLWRAFRRQAHKPAEGVFVGALAGLIPCPLTLFAMFFALSRGVPEAGIIFAISMMLGVALTLSGVAALTVFARQQTVALFEQQGASVERLLRVLDALAGVLLIAIGLTQSLRVL